MKKVRDALNNGIGKGFLYLLGAGIIFWTFCQVRDFPANYQSKAEAAQQEASIKASIESLRHDLKQDNKETREALIRVLTGDKK